METTNKRHRIQRLTMLLLSSLCLVSCGCIRSASTSVRDNTSVENRHEGLYEKLYCALRDSVVKMKAPAEKSESLGLQRSDLETSLARSSAEIDSTGKLKHSIENKDSIPVKTIYRDVYHTKFDTVYESRTDTIRVSSVRYVEKDLTTAQHIQIYMGRMALIAGIACIGIRFLKRNIKA